MTFLERAFTNLETEAKKNGPEIVTSKKYTNVVIWTMTNLELENNSNKWLFRNEYFSLPKSDPTLGKGATGA